VSEVLQYACRLLARREYSAGELRRKLELKWPKSCELDVTLERLVSEGMIDDRRFTEAFIRSRVARLQGPRKIRAELKRRLVADQEITTALEDADLSWSEIAGQWLARQGQVPADYSSKATYYRRLVNRGFTHDQAMDALGQ
jgi:regulatory protein